MGNQKRKAQLERQRRARRRAFAVGVVVVLVALGILVYLFFFRDDAPMVRSKGGRNNAAAFEGGPPTLVYAPAAE